MLGDGNNSRYHTGCPCKGQIEKELFGQYQNLDGANKGMTVEDRQWWKIVVHDAVNPRTEDD